MTNGNAAPLTAGKRFVDFVSTRMLWKPRRGRRGMQTEKTKFNIIIPVYNVGRLCATTILNVLHMDYENYRITLIDDASTDNTLQVCLAFQKLAPDKISVLRSDANRGPTHSVRLGCSYTRDDEIVVQVDGDGDFIRTDILKHYDICFRNPETWLCGAMVEKYSQGTNAANYDMPIGKAFTRKDGVCHFHPRAWRKWLYFKVPFYHLVNPETGQLWRHGSDCSFLWPMWELAGPDRIVFIPFTAYWHNHDNPLNTWKTDHVRRERDSYFNFIQSFDPFKRLDGRNSPVERVPKDDMNRDFDDGIELRIFGERDTTREQKLKEWKENVWKKTGWRDNSVKA